ncbi:MAG: hypothetical protein HY936_00320 [Nitrosomonadales bacterium]|nr:hypothetical protein [Nitrosomonadales bacterium]
MPQFIFGGFWHIWMIHQTLGGGCGLAVFPDPLAAIAGLGSEFLGGLEEIGKQAELVCIEVVHQIDQSGIIEAVIAEQLPDA